MSSVLGRARVAPRTRFRDLLLPPPPLEASGARRAIPRLARPRRELKPDRSKWISVEERRCRLSVKLRPRQEEGDPSPESTSFSPGVGSWGGGTSLLWQNEFTGGKNCRRIAGELQEGKRGDSTRACGWKNINVLGSWLQCFARLVHFLLASWVECNHPM